MGQWTLMSINAQVNNRDNELFGHNFHVFYKLKYTASAFGKFEEPPRLDWHEKCILLNHGDNTWWDFEMNLYDIKPNSETLKPWPRRYIEAYRSAAGTTNRTELKYGSVKLLDKNGAPVAVNKLGANKTTPGEQADTVRHYLKSHGGHLVVEIHDIPGCRMPVPATQNEERLLIFNVGLIGAGLKQQGEQWWRVDGSQPFATWQRSFTMSWQKTFATRGFQKVPTAANLITPMPKAFFAGEYE